MLNPLTNGDIMLGKVAPILLMLFGIAVYVYFCDYARGWPCKSSKGKFRMFLSCMVIACLCEVAALVWAVSLWHP